MANQEFQAISRILLERDYTRNFDPDKVKWEKIIFAADADVDGAHICSLLERLFLMYFPQLIEAGKVYKAVPPLFGYNNGKKEVYFTERIDAVRYTQKEFAKHYIIQHSNGEDISSKELSVVLATNMYYKYWLDKVMNTYAIDPYLLEIILINHINNSSPASLKKQIKANYRFLSVDNKKGVQVIEGTVAGKHYDTVYVTEQLIAECKPVIDILIQNSEVYFKLNGEVVSLYGLMNTFDNFSPDLGRFKGLGEMDDYQLGESTILPNGNRVLMQYTIEDIKEEIEAIREYESNTKLFLKDMGNISRNDLLG